MLNNQHSLYTLPMNQTQNQLINENINKNNLDNTKKKKVTFVETVTVYDVESFKAINKLLTYDENEGLKEFYKTSPYKHNFYDYKSLYDHKHNRNPNYRVRKNPNSNECCIML